MFDFKSAPFTDVIHRLRLDVFETAARSGIDLIFTNNSVWGVPDGRQLFVRFAHETRRRVEDAGGSVLFVQLAAPAAVLEERIGAESRKEHGKLLDRGRLRVLLELLDPEPVHPDDVVIDTSALEPADAAAFIVRELRLRQAEDYQSSGSGVLSQVDGIAPEA